MIIFQRVIYKFFEMYKYAPPFIYFLNYININILHANSVFGKILLLQQYYFFYENNFVQEYD